MAVASIAAATAYQLRRIRDDPGPPTASAEPKAAPLDPSRVTVLFVLGGPGSGKGTNCARLVRDFGFVHLSAGDLLRDEQNRPGSQYGDLIRHYIREGLIVPQHITIALLERAIRARPDQTRFLIDGFPRSIEQGKEFEERVIKGAGVLFFDCPEKELLARLLKRGETSGRADDNIESIRKRFRTFRDTSMPVIDLFAAEGRVHSVSCIGSPDDVYARTRGHVAKLLGT